jgi:CRISPR/Cas system endoribonuclease Cas6 (RAMP superfamily)
VTETNTKVISWEMGKGTNKFKGFIGKVTMTINEPNKEFESWLYVLTKFGTFASAGSQRTAGFGHYRIENIRYAKSK